MNIVHVHVYEPYDDYWTIVAINGILHLTIAIVLGLRLEVHINNWVTHLICGQPPLLRTRTLHL